MKKGIFSRLIDVIKKAIFAEKKAHEVTVSDLGNQILLEKKAHRRSLRQLRKQLAREEKQKKKLLIRDEKERTRLLKAEIKARKIALKIAKKERERTRQREKKEREKRIELAEKTVFIPGVKPEIKPTETPDELTTRLLESLKKKWEPESPPKPVEIPELKIVFQEPAEIELTLDRQRKSSESMVSWLKQKFAFFARDENIDAIVSGAILPDASGVVQIRFTSVEDMDDLLLKMTEQVEDLPGIFKTSIAFYFDPSDIVKPFEQVGEDELKIEGAKDTYNLYRGNMYIPMNVSKNPALQFLDARMLMVPALREATGADPTGVKVTLLYGESVMGIQYPRNFTKGITNVD